MNSWLSTTVDESQYERSGFSKRIITFFPRPMLGERTIPPTGSSLTARVWPSRLCYASQRPTPTAPEGYFWTTVSPVALGMATGSELHRVTPACSGTPRSRDPQHNRPQASASVCAAGSPVGCKRMVSWSAYLRGPSLSPEPVS